MQFSSATSISFNYIDQSPTLTYHMNKALSATELRCSWPPLVACVSKLSSKCWCRARYACQCEHSVLWAVSNAAIKWIARKDLQDPTARLNSAIVPLMTISGMSMKVFIVSRVSAMLTRPNRRLIASVVIRHARPYYGTYLIDSSWPMPSSRSDARSRCFSVLESCGISVACRDQPRSGYFQLKVC